MSEEPAQHDAANEPRPVRVTRVKRAAAGAAGGAPEAEPNSDAQAAPERPAAAEAPLDLSQNLSWMLPFAMLVCAIVAVPLRILAEEGLPRYRALQAEQVDLDAQNERMRREVRDLQREVQALRSDPEAIERIARDELGMVRPGEVIFQFAD